MANSGFFLSAVRWLAREERTTAAAARVLVAPLIVLAGRQLSIVFATFVIALPFSVITLGCVVW